LAGCKLPADHVFLLEGAKIFACSRQRHHSWPGRRRHCAGAQGQCRRHTYRQTRAPHDRCPLSPAFSVAVKSPPRFWEEFHATI
jgi:hypothetical protein